MLKIDFYIPESTIELENGRNPEHLSMDELIYWTFLTQIDFVDLQKNLILLRLPEASLFQIVRIIADARRNFSDGVISHVTARDREGSYDLHIRRNSKEKEPTIVITDEFDNRSFRVKEGDFNNAADAFISKSIAEAERLFPKLLLNKNYLDFKNYLEV